MARGEKSGPAATRVSFGLARKALGRREWLLVPFGPAPSRKKGQGAIAGTPPALKWSGPSGVERVRDGMEEWSAPLSFLSLTSPRWPSLWLIK